MCRQIFITIFHSFSPFPNLELGKSSTDDKCPIAIPWARTCQYQCFYKISVKIFKTIKELWAFFTNCPGTKPSQTDRGQTALPTVRWSIMGHTPKVNLQLLCGSTFLGSFNNRSNYQVSMSNSKSAYAKVNGSIARGCIAICLPI